MKDPTLRRDIVTKHHYFIEILIADSYHYHRFPLPAGGRHNLFRGILYHAYSILDLNSLNNNSMARSVLFSMVFSAANLNPK